MYSLSFPNMFHNSGTRTMLAEDHEATFNNVRLVLLSTKTSLFGDPDFGSSLKRKIFEQNNVVLRDLVIDDIYTTLLTYMPQLVLKREDIIITQEKEKLYATFKCLNLIDYELDTFSIPIVTDGVV